MFAWLYGWHPFCCSILTNIRWIFMTFWTDVHSLEGMNPRDCGHSLTFYLAPPAGQSFHLSYILILAPAYQIRNLLVPCFFFFLKCHHVSNVSTTIERFSIKHGTNIKQQFDKFLRELMTFPSSWAVLCNHVSMLSEHEYIKWQPSWLWREAKT